MRTATSEEEQDQIMAELNRQKTIVAKKHQAQKENYSKNLQERLRSRKQKSLQAEINREKDLAEAELESLEKQQREMVAQALSRTQTTTEKSKIVEINLEEYDTGNPLALLTELPVLKSIQSYEEKLRSQLSYLGGKSGQVLGSLDAPFLDILDAQIGGQKQSLSVLEQIPKESEVVFEMGCQLMDEMFFKLDVPVVKLLIARFSIKNTKSSR